MLNEKIKRRLRMGPETRELMKKLLRESREILLARKEAAKRKAPLSSRKPLPCAYVPDSQPVEPDSGADGGTG